MVAMVTMVAMTFAFHAIQASQSTFLMCFSQITISQEWTHNEDTIQYILNHNFVKL